MVGTRITLVHWANCLSSDSMHNSTYWIEKLSLQKHPEGGWFKEVYRDKSEIVAEGFSGKRSCSTSIYYMLESDDYSSFHRIKSDELWHFYAGTSGVEILWIESKQLHRAKLGADIENGEAFQVVVPKNCWFAARLLNNSGYALMGCTVAPGFDFDDFEMANASLLTEYPEFSEEIEKLL